ncbi:1-phosphofructokinase [Halegenticoccus tardaugens]|uniref:1-phosphofructokinase n=1 Tax=Halegenticoccus tardaugens TaxID=2071624 RepID=UPI00100B86E0|nr:1-phosphofructokinase [Halegenticoccus tardaugens]
MILTVTPNPALDHTLTLDEPLRSGVVHRTDAARFDAGGKGINVSQYLRALGESTLATGFLGDPFGSVLRAQLGEEGVDADFVDIDDTTRLNTTVLTPDGEYKLNHGGPRVGENAVDSLLETIARHDPETVLVAGSLPRGIDATAIDRISAAGSWEVAVDVGGDLLRSLSGRYALCKPNREELAAATDEPVDTVEGCTAAAEALRARGFDRVVASLGADGAVMATEAGALYAPALETDVVDTVGAGDALLSGVLAALARGEPDAVALKYGVAVASRVTAVAGTVVPGFDDVRADVEAVSVSEC